MSHTQTFYFFWALRPPIVPVRGDLPGATLAASSIGGHDAHRSRKRRSLTMKTPMFASIRKYNAAPTMVDELVKHQDEIKSALRPIPGFHAYYLLKTSDGAISLTVCEERVGAEESNRVASTWLKDKLPTFATRAPEITTGEVRIQLDEQLVPVNA
jgi:hypothetical protein